MKRRIWNGRVEYANTKETTSWWWSYFNWWINREGTTLVYILIKVKLKCNSIWVLFILFYTNFLWLLEVLQRLILFQNFFHFISLAFAFIWLDHVVYIFYNRIIVLFQTCIQVKIFIYYYSIVSSCQIQCQHIYERSQQKRFTT
jgi:hypothetical protein